MSAATQSGSSGTDEIFRVLQTEEVRLVSIFGSSNGEGKKFANYILDLANREYRVMAILIDGALPTATATTPAAAWYERELRDRYGIEIQGHPDPRPLLFHTADYPFLKVDGVGVCEVPVGPVHAGIIEPGHFRFSVVGDTVLHLELRHFYTHKGTETIFEGTPVLNGAIIAESISGDNCFAHAVAYSQAVEHGCDAFAPRRAQGIRLVGLELERVLAHIGDVGALCGDVGFAVPAAYTSRLKERLLRESTRAIGTRYWRSISVPGGVTRDISAEGALSLGQATTSVAREFAEIAQMILDTPSVQNRFESTGVLKPNVARQLAVVGPVARASGLRLDVRHDHPYGAYRDCAFEPVTYHYGDVLARARVRIDETAASALLIDEALEDLPSGPIYAKVDSTRNTTGLSAVESPRGELLYWIHMDGGTIQRCHVKSPSFQNWPALPLAMHGNIIADFPLINKSFNLSYSGCDR
ncbi:MAG: NADH-quinone oxidoreductase subunit C [Acidobacteriaceae bacterium]